LLVGAVSLVFNLVITAFALRFGYVAGILAFFFSSLLDEFPWTTDMSTWMAPQAVLLWGIAAAFLAYGFVTATRGRSLFRDPLGTP
jgi:hypothetical protein